MRSFSTRFLSAILVCAAGAAIGKADTIIVNWDGSGDYTTIQTGLNAAGDYDTVIVYSGTYREILVFPNRAITLTCTDPADPAVVAATIIDADLDGDPNTPNGRVVTFASGDAERVLTGLTITGGFAPGWPGPENGGGVLLDEAWDVSLSFCVITGNRAQYYGGGVYGGWSGSEASISHCAITDNQANYGGGIGAYYGAITSCVISGNHGSWGGGGLYNCYGPISNSVIRGNHAWESGGGLYRCDGTITNCIIVDNTAGDDWETYGGGLYDCSGLIANCTISRNNAIYGAGLAQCDNISNSLIVGNGVWYDSAYDSYSGGGLYDCGTVKNSLISGNQAREAGGAYAVNLLQNCTIARNEADYGSGVSPGWTNTTINSSIIWYDSVDDPYTQVSIAYSDVEGGWSGTANIDADPLWAPALAGTWLTDGAYEDDEGKTTLIDVTGAWLDDELVGLTINPDTSQASHFVIAGNNAFSVTVWGDASFVFGGSSYQIHDYYLEPNSPCRNTGDPSYTPDPGEKDLYGYPRVAEGVVDIGAFEFQPDCNGNGIPDWAELAANVVATDDAEDAWPICAGPTYVASTVNATCDGAASCGSSDSSPDIWYRYTPASNGTTTISLCGSSYDTVLSVHSGAPGDLANEIICNDDVCGYQSEVTFSVNASVTYYIRIAGYAGVAGDVELILTGPDCAEQFASDCNENGVPDECDIASGASWDCDANGVPDECEYTIEDCNGNEIPDHCELDGNDCNNNGVPDECDLLSVFDLAPFDNYTTWGYASETAIGDFDEDGDVDVAVAAGWDDAYVFLNEGLDGDDWQGFNSNGLVYALDGFAAAVVAADFDDDGRLDLVFVDSNDYAVSVLLNMGRDAGEWLGFDAPVVFPTSDYTSAIAAGDLDNDGYPELVVTDSSDTTGGVSVFPNNGSDAGGWLGFGAPVDYPMPSAVGVAIGDVNADNFLDVAVVSAYPENSLAVFVNKRTGILKPPVAYGVNGTPSSVCMGDLDGDSDLDMVVASFYGGSLTMSVWNNAGDGAYIWDAEYAAFDDYYLSHVDMIVADMGGDNAPDIVAAGSEYYGPGAVAVLLNDGAGMFPELSEFASTDIHMAVSCSDFDGDTLKDLVVANGEHETISVLLNATACNSQDANDNGIPDECEEPQCPGDLNGDNRVDLSDLAQLLGRYGVTSGMTYYDGDLDGDGDVDLNDLAALLGYYGVTCE